ncbi:MAG TPA: hypothetical protein VF669_08085 [Tepidisphaeraceae bacterium]|jgi:hypothetical protein
MARNSSSNRGSSKRNASTQRPGQTENQSRSDNAHQGSRNGAARSRSRSSSSRKGQSQGGQRGKSQQLLRPEDVKPYEYPQRENAKSFAGRAVETVTEHPVPAILIGAGLTWLLMESSSMRKVEQRLYNQGKELLGGVGETLSDYADTAREALSGAAEYVGETLAPAAELPSRLGEYATEGVSSVGNALSEGASAVGHGVEAGYEYTRDAIADVFERHPVASCAAILAAGVAAGMLLPGTVRENKWMGRTSEALSRNVREKGAELLEQGRSFASTAAQSVTRAVGLAGGESQSNNRRSNRGGNRSKRS